MHHPSARPRDMGTRFGFTTLYGLPGWVLVASVLAIVCALVAVSAALAHARLQHPAGTAPFVAGGCAVSGDAAGAMDWVAFYDDPMRHMGGCADSDAKTAGAGPSATSAAR